MRYCDGLRTKGSMSGPRGYSDRPRGSRLHSLTIHFGSELAGISPTQINVVVPGIAAGAVNVQVTGNNGSSQVVSLQAGTVSPGLFLVLQDRSEERRVGKECR